MAQNSWPSPAYNSRNVTDAEYEKIASRFSDDGVDGDPTGTAVVSAGGGLSVNIRAEARASVRGHAWYSGGTTVNLAVGANTSGSTRVDRVVLRLDRATWTVRAVIKAGTPGGGAPALTQQTGDSGTYEIPLANVTVLNGASSVSVARAEMYVGSRCRPCTASTRNPAPDRGELGYETDTGRLILWTGSSWSSLNESSGSVSCDSPLAAWAITVESSLEMVNGTVFLRLGTWDRKGSALGATTDARLPVLIPSKYRHPNRNVYAMAYISGAQIGRVTIYPANNERAGQVWITQKPVIGVNDSVLPASVSWVVG
ncbi:hypothetical protein [Streptomyces sp. NPDC052225]|uniref:hypothetical protein n=1 Tax=Streptomyces sp. NPDC052225 TaxID=3154949 RepID=UPI00344993B4